MKTITKTIIPLFFILLLLSCNKETIRVTDDITEVEVNISDYDGIKISDAFTVYLNLTEQNKGIVVEANANLHEKIILEKEGTYLRIKIKKNTTIKGEAVMNIYINTPAINEVYATGASEVILNNTWVNTKSKIELSGASRFTGEVNIQALELNLSGASYADLFGSLTSLKASLNGSSNLKDYDLDTASLELQLSGASTSFLSVSDRIKVHASGASVLMYKGDAIIEEQQLSGSSQVKKINS